MSELSIARAERHIKLKISQGRFGEEKDYDLWSKQINFYRDHLDIFIEEMFHPIKLKNKQKVIARAFGRSSDIKIVDSRGAGKSWLIALCCIAMAILYPGTLVAVCSGTAQQATIVLQKVKALSVNPNILREIDQASSRSPVTLSKDKGMCKFKNGSEIESYSVTTMRGNRAKIIVVDESPEVNQGDLEAVVSPVRNFKRSVYYNYGIPDYESKIVNISSACEKSNHFYGEFIRVMRGMKDGDRDYFAAATDFTASARAGVTDMKFFEAERKRLPKSKFDMEYGSLFLGAESNSVFPYDLTESCRTQLEVETSMPKGSQSKYVVSLDIATSDKKTADNAVLAVVKLIEREDGLYTKRLVSLRSFHGNRLPVLANEVRKTVVKFPNTIKVAFDHRGLGDSFPSFMDEPWTDPETGKEYPPYICDDIKSYIHNAIPILRSVKANLGMNQGFATSLRVALEQRTLELPVNARRIYDGKVIEINGDEEIERPLTSQEQAIYIEADALQIEMGNIVGKQTQSGNYVYDVARPTQHKDRYSALAMAVAYIGELEAERVRKIHLGRTVPCIGIASNF